MDKEPITYTKRNLLEISNLISEYSAVYQKFEDLQEKGLLAGGDQKTGVIGEYYAAKYIQKKYGVETIYARHGAEHDLEYNYKKKTYKIQVKAVSFHSKTRTISPIKNGDWDELYLISLDKQFKPVGFWINKKDSIKFDKDEIPSARMPQISDKIRDGRLNFSKNLIKDFL